MHLGQFIVINSKNRLVFENSLRELVYHSELLEEMRLGKEPKIQVHIGGVYKDKSKSLRRFIENFNLLPQNVKSRLVIENDDKFYSIKDCLTIHQTLGIPIVFDNFHHLCNPGDLDLDLALRLALFTWEDSSPMIDYSNGDFQKKAMEKALTKKILESLFLS